MSAPKDGGQAFPRPHSDVTRGDGAVLADMPAQDGMSLRDYFAGQVLVAALHRELAAGSETFKYDQRAAFAYRMADAMLDEREKATPKGGG